MSQRGVPPGATPIVPPLPADALRARAERFASVGAIAPGRTADELQRQLHELQVSLIELEMQNVALAELQGQKEYVEQGLQHFVDLYQQAPAPYLSVSRGGRIVRTNLAAERLLGASGEQLFGQPLERFVDAAEQGAFRVFLDAVFGGAVAALELPLVIAGQAACLVRVTANVDPVALLCRLVFSALGSVDRRAELRRETIVRIGPISAAVVVTSLADGILHANAAYGALTGYHGDELVGRPSSFLQQGATPPAELQRVRQLLVQQGFWHGELICRHKSGTYFSMEMSVMAVRGRDGQFDHYVALCAARVGSSAGGDGALVRELQHAQRIQWREQDRREQAERDLRASQQLQHATLDALPERVLLLDAAGIVLYANLACRRFAGRASAGLDYGRECQTDSRWLDGAGAAVAAGLAGVAAGQLDDYALDYGWQAGAGTRLRFRVRISRLAVMPRQLMVVHAERKPANGAGKGPSLERSPALPARHAGVGAATGAGMAGRRLPAPHWRRVCAAGHRSGPVPAHRRRRRTAAVPHRRRGAGQCGAARGGAPGRHRARQRRRHLAAGDP